MEAKELFFQALQQTTLIVDQVSDEDFSKPTPDTDWNTGALLAHMLGGMSRAADTIQGMTLEKVQKRHGDVRIKSAISVQVAWNAATEAALHAAREVRNEAPVHTVLGVLTAEEYLIETGANMLIHAWDLAKAIGVPIIFDAYLAECVYLFFEPLQDVLCRIGVFAPPVPVATDASAQDKLLALTGRNPAWTLS